MLGVALLWLGLTRPVFFPFACVSLPVAVGVLLYGRRGEGTGRRGALVCLLAVGFLAPYLLWQEIGRAHV